MKLLHTSDWHLGMAAGQMSFLEDQRDFFDQLYSIIQREQVTAVLCAGDVYDSSVSNADAIELYNQVMTTLCMELHVTCIVIAGNHDGAERLASCSELLKRAGLFVSGRLKREITPVAFRDVDVYPIPFFHKDEVVALYPERQEEIHSEEDAMRIVCEDIRTHMDTGKRNIVMAHAFVVGAALSDSDRSARVGQATAISKDVFAGFDYVALGHIHKPQSITEQVRYSGTPLKYSFGAEETQEKSVTILDTATMQQTIIPIRPKHDRRSVIGAYDDVVQREDIRNDYLKLTITDRYATLDLIRELQTIFPYLLEINGKDAELVTAGGGITMEELGKLDEQDIMKKYMRETFAEDPTAEQIQLFEAAMRAIEEEVKKQ